LVAQRPTKPGEIKNVILNAARLAVCRAADATVSANDFAEAVRMELEGRWSVKGRMGFAAGGSA
jgi:hypothetical protein